MFPSAASPPGGNNNRPPPAHKNNSGQRQQPKNVLARNNTIRSGGGGSRQQPYNLPAVYQPSIYSYYCRGAYFVSSEDNNNTGSSKSSLRSNFNKSVLSRNNNNNTNREGTCRGIKTRLRLLSDMDPSTREVAIKNFTYMTDYELDEGGTGNDGDSGNSNSLNQKTKSILVSPALIYKDNTDSINNNNNNNDGNNDNSKRTTTIEKNKSQQKQEESSLPEEELIRRQKWSCYGSTEIELLMLRNVRTGKEHIAAVAPRNVGVSIRKIEAEGDGSSITSIGVGWLNIVVDAGPSFIDDDDEDDEEELERQRQRQREFNKAEGGTMSSTNNDAQQQQQSTSSMPEEVPPRPSATSLGKAKDAIKNVYVFSGKVASHMKTNVEWLGHNMTDDFPRRTYAASQKIVDHLPKTIDKTGQYMNKVYDKWFKDDDNDDDDNGDNNAGGRGGRGGRGGPAR